MRKVTLLVALLAITSNLYAQFVEFSPSEVTPLFKKDFNEIQDFLVTKNYSFLKTENYEDEKINMKIFL